MATKNLNINDLLEYLAPDRIYAVNLKHRVDRLIRFDAQMRSRNIPYTLIDGVNGRASFLCQQKLQTYLRKRKDENELMDHIADKDYLVLRRRATLGSIGYMESQRRIFQDALNNNYKKIIVFDDDAIINDFVKPVDEKFFDYIKDAKIFLLGCSEYATEEQIKYIDSSRHLYYPVEGRTCGSFAVFYTRETFEPILEYIDKIGNPFDNVVLGNLYKNMRQYCIATKNQFVIADVTESELRHGREQEEHSKVRNWDIRAWLANNEPAIISIILSSPDDLVEVNLLEQNIGKNIFLNFYYISEDGLRPFHPGSLPLTARNRLCKVCDFDTNFLSSANPDNIAELLEDKALPFSEYAILWKKGGLNLETILGYIRKITIEGGASGETGGNIWARQCGRRFVPGLHSVIIPTVRGLKNLAPTIKSALDQNIDNVEIIIVNDNPERKLSADAFKTIFANHPSIEKKYIRVINHKRNLNGAAARNTGLLNAWGEYISFLDDDDLYCVSRLQSVQNAMRDVSDIKNGGAYCAFARGWELNSFKLDPDRLIPGTIQSHIIKLNYDKHYVHTNTVTFHRNYINAINGFDESFERHQDIELMTRFYANFKLSVANVLGAILKPSKTEATFSPTLNDLLSLKIKYLSNFKLLLKRYYKNYIPEIVKCHLRDFNKYFKDISKEETDELSRILLKTILDDQYIH